MEKHEIKILAVTLALFGVLCIAGFVYASNQKTDQKDKNPMVSTPWIEENEIEEHEMEKSEITEVVTASTQEALNLPDPHEGQRKSYLTGEWKSEELTSKRPVAIMLNNSRGGVPQNGLSQASVVYEATMEGSETRLMGFFEDYDQIERIGSVRSCRPYFVYFALEFDAIYCHYGQAWVADELLSAGVIENVSGLKGGSDAYYRSTDRKAPHNVFTNATLIRDTVAKLGYDFNYPAEYTGHYQFAQEGETSDYPQGETAVYVKPGYPVNKPWFEYHTEDGLYYRFQYGKPQIDECSGQQVAFRNLIFQYCDSSIYSGSEYVNFDVTSGGRGMFITNGKAIPITWKKDSTYGVTHYYDENGTEIRLNQGKTWVCVMQTTQEDHVVIADVIPET